MLRILYQDDALVAIDKPAGLLVHRTPLDAGESRFALQLARDQIGRPLWPAHRLDKGTSGVLLFATDAAIAARLGQAFATEGAVRKTYHAVVRGWPQGPLVIDHPLARMADERRAARAALPAQPARTRMTVLGRCALPIAHGPFDTTRCALLALTPETGRRHQLRRHCKHVAHPIIGDATHGKGPLNRALAGWLSIARLWLHASALALAHPAHGAPLLIEAPPGPEWARWPLERVAGAAA